MLCDFNNFLLYEFQTWKKAPLLLRCADLNVLMFNCCQNKDTRKIYRGEKSEYNVFSVITVEMLHQTLSNICLVFCSIAPKKVLHNFSIKKFMYAFFMKYRLLRRLWKLCYKDFIRWKECISKCGSFVLKTLKFNLQGR